MALGVAACGRAPATSTARPPLPAPVAALSLPRADEAADAGLAQIDPDGDDDASDTGSGEFPGPSHFERVGRAPLSLRRVCDLTVFNDALYAAHANDPLGSDGATITKYVPGERPFRVAFDWNRPGEPREEAERGKVSSASTRRAGDSSFPTRIPRTTASGSAKAEPKASSTSPTPGVNDYFCAPPLAVFRNELYAGGQRDGAIFRLAQ